MDPLFRALGEEPPQEGPSAEVLARVAGIIVGEMAAHVRWLARAGLVATVVLVLGSLTLSWVEMRPDGFASLASWVCFPGELIVASVPFSIVFLGYSRWPVGRSPLMLAGYAALGACVGQVVVHKLCPAHDAEHLFVLHTGGVVVAAGLAAVAGLPRARRHATI